MKQIMMTLSILVLPLWQKCSGRQVYYVRNITQKWNFSNVYYNTKKSNDISSAVYLTEITAIAVWGFFWAQNNKFSDETAQITHAWKFPVWICQNLLC